MRHKPSSNGLSIRGVASCPSHDVGVVSCLRWKRFGQGRNADGRPRVLNEGVTKPLHEAFGFVCGVLGNGTSALQSGSVDLTFVSVLGSG